MVRAKSPKPAPEAQPPRRLLLLEFVLNERWFFYSRFFPFVKGAAAKLGIPATWLCLGSVIHSEKEGRTGLVQWAGMDEADVATLDGHLAALRPTHVVISHPLPPAVLERLRAACPGVSVLSLSDHPSGPGVVYPTDFPPRRGSRRAFVDHVRTDWLLAWLGEMPDTSPDFDRFIAGTFEPSYDAVMGNPQARAYRPNLLLIGGVACDHFGRLRDNDHYRGLDLSGTSHPYGCAFCTWYRGPNSDMTIDPVELAEAQLRRIVETAGPEGRFCGGVEVYDVRVFRRLERFAERVLALGMPPCRFGFEPRMDAFLQEADALDRALYRLEAAGHSIQLQRMGAETLVEEENRRYNKDISPDQIRQAVRRLAEIQAAHPGSFEYDRTVGYITCSPWTTLEMLEEGTEASIEMGLDPTGVWLFTPLLLFRGAPISRLAQAEGDLLVDEYEDVSLVYEPSINNVPFTSILPWRFRDARTGVAFALIVRFCAAGLRKHRFPDTIFDGDALYAELRAREAEADGFRRPDLFARDVIALVKAGRAPYDRHAVLDEALRRCAARPRTPDGGREGGESRESPEAAAQSARLRRIVEAVVRKLGAFAADVAVEGARADPAGQRLRLDLIVGGAPCRIDLADANAGGPCLFRTDRLAVSHDAATDLSSPARLEKVRGLVAVLERALARHAPDLLDGDRHR